MEFTFPMKFNVEVELPNGQTVVQSHDGRVSQKPKPSYSGDWLTTYHKNMDFMHERAFSSAYNKGINSGHNIMGGGDLHIEWRVHTCIWAAQHAAKLDGDFVECGVNTGILSLAVMEYLNFNALDKKFFLFDTYKGIPTDQISKEELSLDREKDNSYYFDCLDLVKRNFAPYKNAVIVPGKVPDTLNEVAIDKVSYLSIDMNIVEPEIAAGEHFWNKIVPGGIIILDDYGWEAYRLQKEAWDRFAKARGVSILTMPTGQGIIIKP